MQHVFTGKVAKMIHEHLLIKAFNFVDFSPMDFEQIKFIPTNGISFIPISQIIIFSWTSRAVLTDFNRFLCVSRWTLINQYSFTSRSSKFCVNNWFHWKRLSIVESYFCDFSLPSRYISRDNSKRRSREIADAKITLALISLISGKARETRWAPEFWFFRLSMQLTPSVTCAVDILKSV